MHQFLIGRRDRDIMFKDKSVQLVNRVAKTKLQPFDGVFSECPFVLVLYDLTHYSDGTQYHINMVQSPQTQIHCESFRGVNRLDVTKVTVDGIDEMQLC